MHSFKLILTIICFSVLQNVPANEQLIPAQSSNDGIPGILGDTQFPPFSGMLFAGTSGNSANPIDTMNGVSLIDIDTGTVVFTAPEVQAWGAAADPVNRRILFSVASNSIGSQGGDELFALSYDGGTPESLGVILDPLGEPLRMDGLAMIEGELFAALDGAAGGGDPDGLYRVNLDEKNSELVISFTGIGGLDSDPVSGRLFGTNDDTGMLVEIDITAGTVTDLVAYPQDFVDIDAMAAGENILYLITDEDQDIQLFDLNSNSFTGSLPSPFINADVFAGAALAFELPLDEEFIPPAIPTLSLMGLLILSSLLALIGWLIVRRSQFLHSTQS